MTPRHGNEWNSAAFLCATAFTMAMHSVEVAACIKHFSCRYQMAGLCRGRVPTVLNTVASNQMPSTAAPARPSSSASMRRCKHAASNSASECELHARASKGRRDQSVSLTLTRRNTSDATQGCPPSFQGSILGTVPLVFACRVGSQVPAHRPFIQHSKYHRQDSRSLGGVPSV